MDALYCIVSYTAVCPDQFGFKRKLGTDTCIYVLKEIVDKYRSLNGGIFMCILYGLTTLETRRLRGDKIEVFKSDTSSIELMFLYTNRR